MTVKGKGKQVARKAPASSSSSSSKRKNPISVDESSSAQPKRKRSGVLRFVDDAAADADHGGKDEDDDLEWEDLDFEFEVKNLSKGSGKPGLIPFFIKEEEMDDVELEEAIKERYLQGSQFVSYDEDVKECDDLDLVAHTMKDLTFWRVKCVIGRERQAAFCLMQKFVDLQKIGKKLQIFSVFAIEHVKGFVYIEADKVSNVLEACNGLCILYQSRIDLVPSSEAPTLLAIQNKACGISKGMWVRMKSGKYKGDLAEVVFVNDVKKRATIKLVPRIDLQAIAKKFGGGTSLKASPIPDPRLISPHELEDFRPHLQVSKDRETGEIFEVLDGLMLKDGYLYKKVSTCSLIYWGVQPSSAELLKFEEMGKDEVKDVSWLSSVYKARMKKKLPETSNQKNGDKSNPKDGDKKGSGFEIDDLILFGKKDCGIIVDKENDSFKILKGDVSGSEVVTIRIQEIKKNCVDKVFTAADRCYKTISIDDIVKVSEGPLEVGREGIVRHMYKGFLFIYDDCQSENNGFFCAKSGMCDLVKKSREVYGGKSGSKAGASFAQSPIRSAEQAENSQSFSRNHQSNSRGTFSVGQTLRIRKGPLKGYLCRVIRIYRADITVKLDSLAKLLTVDEKLLSFANSKKDDSTAMPSDIFGAQEPSIGGVQDERRGLEMDNCQMNDGMSSFSRDSWGAPSSSNFAFAPANDNKGQDQGADPWGCKLSSFTGAQEQGVNNSWGKALCPIAEQSSWNKMESENNDGDAWNKASTKSDTASVAWKNDNTSSVETEQTWSMKGGSNGWGVAAKNAIDGRSDSGGLSTAELTDPGDRQTLGENSWNRPAKASTVSITETSGWEKSKPSSSDAGGSWNTKDASADWNKEASGKDRSRSFGGQSSNWACQKSGGDKQDSWDIKGKDLLKNDDRWGQFTASDEKTPVASNPWDSSSDCAVPIKAWETISTDGNQAADWGVSASSVELRSQMSNCDKAKVAPSSTGGVNFKAGVTEAEDWKKTNDVNEATDWAASAMNSDEVKTLSSTSVWERSNQASPTETEGWKKTADYNQVAGCVSVMHSAAPSGEHGSQTSSWGKVKTPTSSGWEKPKQVGTAETGGWKDGLSNQTQIDEWNKEKSSGMDQASGWNKAGNKDSGQDGFRDRWDKAKNFEGHGQENHKEWKTSDHWQKDQHDANFGKPTDSDWSQGSGWSQGHFRNGNGKNWEQGNYGKQQRDFDGGRGSSMGRGRARYGGRGSRNENDFEKPGDSDGGWRSGKGGGRFGCGAGAYRRDDSNNTRQFGRGRGCGRGRDQGRSSSWGGDEDSGWGKSTLNSSEISAGAIDGNSGWSSRKSVGGVNTSQISDRQDAIGSENEPTFNKSTWSGQEKDSFGTQTSDWGNGGGNNWSKQKTSDAYEKPAWNNTSEGSKEGGYQGQSGNWRGRSEFGRGRSSGGRGRGNSFSGSGYGRGRNSGGRNSFAWNSGDGSGNEENDSGGSWNRKKGSFEGEKGSWNTGGHAEMGSQGIWKANGKCKPTSWTTEASGWTAASAASAAGKGESSKSGWDSATDFGSQGASILGFASAKGFEADNADGTGRAGGWSSTKEAGSSSGQKDDPLASSNARKGGQEPSWNKEGSGWNTGSSPKAVKEAYDGESAWNKTTVQVVENTERNELGSGWDSVNVSKQGASDVNGSSWNGDTDAACSKDVWIGEQGEASTRQADAVIVAESDNPCVVDSSNSWGKAAVSRGVSGKEGTLASSNARKGGQESSWNKEGCGWNTGSSPKAAKGAYDGESAWNKTTVQVEQNTEGNELGSCRDSVNVSKQGASDVNGSSWNVDTDAAGSKDVWIGEHGEASTRQDVGVVAESDNPCVLDSSDSGGKAAVSLGVSGKEGNAGW